ncbi:MAG: hypothetical protein LBL39_06590, partial [Planctomycetaceae bacterium]|nr:hypothetical protein [Planctomycetaceae bacterium]
PNGKLYDGFGNNFWIAKNDDEELIDSPILKIFNPSNNIDIVPIINFGSHGEEVQKDSESNVLVNDKREINSSAVLATLHVKILLRDSSTDQMIWLPPSRTNDPKGYIKYDGQQHSQDDIVLPNKTETEDTCEANDLFICLPPTFSPTTSVSNWTRSQIVAKNGQYWRWLSHSHKLNRMRVVVFSPYVSPLATENSEEGINYKTSHVRVTTASYDSTDDIWKFTDKIEGTDENPFGINPQDINQKYINEVTIPNLVPGIRKIFVYGYVANDETNTHSNAHRSNVQTIEIKPGENFITIYLNEII